MRSLLLLALISSFACAPAESEAASATGGSGRLVVYTANYPLAFFAEWIGGAAVLVEFPAPAGQDPARWSPDPETLAAYREADLVLLNGAGHAAWSEGAALPPARTVNTSVTRSKRLIEGETPGVPVATTWLDLSFALDQARTVTFVLSGARPQFRENFERNFAALEAELLELEARWKGIVAADPARPLLGSRSSYAYLAARYGIALEWVSLEPDRMPDDDGWRALEDLLRSHPARWMLWDREPRPEIAARLRGLGVGSVVFDPCAGIPGDASDFLDVMQANAEALETVFEQP